MRVLLAIAVTVAQFAGPWLCCCPAQAAQAPVPAAFAPVNDADGGCHHCRASRPPVNEPPESPAPRLPDRCPCGGANLDAVAVPPAGPDAAARLTALPFPPVPWLLAPNTSDANSSRTTFLAGVNPLPFLPPGDRLWVHHALRC